jgi:hypothetical protein
VRGEIKRARAVLDNRAGLDFLLNNSSH